MPCWRRSGNSFENSSFDEVSVGEESALKPFRENG